MKITNDLFIQKSKQVHFEKYNYSKCLFINLRSKVLLICNTCNTEFLQRASNHLNGHGCKYCNSRKTKITLESFLIKAKKVHNTNYNYTLVDFIDMQTTIKIICKNNHIFEQTPSKHLLGRGCSLCNNRSVQTHTKETFINKAKIIHNKYLYNYTLVNYVNNNTKVKIICPLHGQFEQTPRSHLSGRGCKKCTYKLGYSRSDFIKRACENVCTFYLIKCFKQDEQFYKIGITSKSTEERFKNKLPYNYEIIFEIKDNAENIWDLESKFKKELKLIYKPNIDFNGSKTECFSNVDLLLDWQKSFV